MSLTYSALRDLLLILLLLDFLIHLCFALLVSVTIVVLTIWDILHLNELDLCTLSNSDLTEAFIEEIGSDESILLIFVRDYYQALILTSIHEGFPEVGLRPECSLKNIGWVDLQVGLVALAPAADSDGDIHVDLEADLLVHVALDRLLHLILGEGPVGLVRLHLHQDDVCLLEKPNQLEDILLKAPHLVLDVDLHGSNVIGVINHNFFLLFGLRLNVDVMVLLLSVIGDLDTFLFSLVLDGVAIDLLSILLWVLLLYLILILSS